MSDLKNILGNDQLIEHFQIAVKQNKVSHAYILEGEKGSGKKMMAAAFAKILQCEKRQKDGNVSDACDQCTSCIQVEHKNHPDVIWVRHEKPGVISVSEIREQVVNTMDIMPYKGPYKIYIIDEAEKMNQAAQNAILKTIEEPPAYGMILLLTSNRGAFLPTIVSRCVLLTVKPVSDQIIRDYLLQKFHVSEQTADICASFAMGNVGKAMHAALSEEFSELRQFAISVLQYMHEKELFELAEQVKQMKIWKDSSDDILDIMLMWFRDVLLLKFSDGENEIIFKEEYPFLRKQSDLLSFEIINAIILEIEHARKRMRANVNYDASLEVLLMFIRKKYDGGNT